MGKLAIELRKRFKSPQEALAKLGLDSSLLDDAWSTKAKARKEAAKRGMAIDSMEGGEPDDNDTPWAKLEKLCAEHMGGEVFEKAQRIINDLLHSAVRQEEDGGMVDDQEEEEAEAMDPAEAREFRRWQLKGLGDRLMKDYGWSLDRVGKMMRHPDFPKTGIETGGAGGGALAEDIDFTMKELEGVGTGGLVNNKSTSDRRKRMARDRALARDAAFKRDLLMQYPGVASGLFGIGEGDPAIAMDAASEEQSADDYARADAWFGLSRIRQA